MQMFASVSEQVNFLGASLVFSRLGPLAIHGQSGGVACIDYYGATFGTSNRLERNFWRFDGKHSPSPNGMTAAALFNGASVTFLGSRSLKCSNWEETEKKKSASSCRITNYGTYQPHLLIQFVTAAMSNMIISEKDVQLVEGKKKKKRKTTQDSKSS